jgi:hypothetical protein
MFISTGYNLTNIKNFDEIFSQSDLHSPFNISSVLKLKHIDPHINRNSLYKSINNLFTINKTLYQNFSYHVDTSNSDINENKISLYDLDLLSDGNNDGNLNMIYGKSSNAEDVDYTEIYQEDDISLANMYYIYNKYHARNIEL